MMNTNQKISLALLVGRLITVIIMFMVARKQYQVLKVQNYPELTRLRRTLFLGSLIVLAGNILPVVIDVMGVFNRGSFGLLLAYVFSNNFTALLGAYLLWYNINLAERIKLIDIEEQRAEVEDARSQE